MEEALISQQAFPSFIIPLFQGAASVVIAWYAMQQEKIARLQAARELSERYFEIYRKFSALYNATLQFEGSSEKWKTAWFECRNAQEEAGCLYGLYHQGDNRKAVEIDALFSSGMEKCLALSSLINDNLPQNSCSVNLVALVNEAPWSQDTLKELSQIKSHLLNLMYNDIQLRDSMDRASM